MPMPGYLPEVKQRRLTVDGQAISTCLTRMQEVERILAGLRNVLTQACGEDKADESKDEKAPPTISSLANLGGAYGQTKAGADVQWETTHSAYSTKEKEKPPKAEAPVAISPSPSPNPQAVRAKTGSSKWSSIDRQGLIDQVVINTSDFVEEEPDQDHPRHNHIHHGASDSAETSDPDLSPIMAQARQIEMVHTCWGRMKVPIVHPSSQLRLTWLLIGFAFVIYEAYSIPFYLSYNLQPEGFFYYLVSTINSYFIADIIMSFLTGYIDNDGVVVLEPLRIAKRYIMGWLVPDIVASIPWEWINTGQLGQITKGIRFIRAFRLLRLTRLFRLMRTNAVTEKLEIFIEANQLFMFLVGLARILFLLFGVTHWMACAWYALGMREVSEKDTTWVEAYVAQRWAEEESFPRYIESLYFTLTTMTTVGYGDRSAQNLEETCFVLLLLLVASIVFAGLMGVLTDLISNLNNEKNAKNDKKAQLSRYMRWRAVPNDLFLTIRQYVLFIWDENEQYEEYEEWIKGQLSPALKTELCYHIYGRLLYSSPFFAWMRDYDVCLKQLATMVQSLFLSRGDCLFKVGQCNEQIYLLLSGSVWLTRNQSLWNASASSGAASAGLNPFPQDTLGPVGPEGFSIPRNREGGLREVRKLVKSKTKMVQPKVEAGVLAQVVGHWRRRCKTEQMLSDPEELRPPKKKKYGMDPSGNAIFDSTVLTEATVALKRRDLREKRAALTIQRRWRVQKKSLAPHMTRTKSLRASAMHSKTITAPAYFGESCLWVPMEKWGKEEPPLYTYTARCESRGELVYISRDAIQEILEMYSPWLGERFECFRQSVTDSLARLMRNGQGLTRNASGQWVDWASMDLSSPSEDDISMSAMHCKTLLRAAAPSRTQMTILRSAATQSRPAMPRTPTYTFDTPAVPRTNLHRMQSNLSHVSTRRGSCGAT